MRTAIRSLPLVLAFLRDRITWKSFCPKSFMLFSFCLAPCLLITLLCPSLLCRERVHREDKPSLLHLAVFSIISRRVAMLHLPAQQEAVPKVFSCARKVWRPDTRQCPLEVSLEPRKRAWGGSNRVPCHCQQIGLWACCEVHKAPQEKTIAASSDSICDLEICHAVISLFPCSKVPSSPWLNKLSEENSCAAQSAQCRTTVQDVPLVQANMYSDTMYTISQTWPAHPSWPERCSCFRAILSLLVVFHRGVNLCIITYILYINST